MKKYVLEFVRRGLIACGFGPLVLAVLYLILQKEANLETLTVNQVCLGILSLSALANEHRITRFDAVFNGGVDAVFQCGYREYVSRRCFAEIRRRFEGR